MDRLRVCSYCGVMSNTQTISTPATTHRPDPEAVVKAIEKRSFMNMATVSESGAPHVAGVLYAFVDGVFYLSTLRSSRKARNIEANPKAAVTIPIRRVPVGPPSTVQFQATAEVLDPDSPEILELVEEGRIEEITGHGELDLDGGCFIRLTPADRWTTYGLGMSVIELARDPLAAGGAVHV